MKKTKLAGWMILIVALSAFATPAPINRWWDPNIGVAPLTKPIRDAHESTIRDRLPSSLGSFLTDSLKEPLTLGRMRTETYDSQDITKFALDAGIFTREQMENGEVTDRQLRKAFDHARVVQFRHNPGVMRVVANTSPALGTAINWNAMNAIQKATSLFRDVVACLFIGAYIRDRRQPRADRAGKSALIGNRFE